VLIFREKLKAVQECEALTAELNKVKQEMRDVSLRCHCSAREPTSTPQAGDNDGSDAGASHVSSQHFVHQPTFKTFHVPYSPVRSYEASLSICALQSRKSTPCQSKTFMNSAIS